jgi:hypothetical protein
MPIEFKAMRNPANGSVAEIPADAADAHEARGWEPLTDARTYGQAQQERADFEAEALEAAQAAAEAVDQGGTVAEVLADVGDDPDKAQAALEAEQAGKQRVSLMNALSKVIDRHGQDDAAGQTTTTDKEQ